MRLLHLITILALFFPCPVLAAVIEEVISVPVRVRTITGEKISQPIKVTIFRDDKLAKAPWLVLNHGRPASEADFAGMKRQRYSANSRYFVALGFVVLVPTRVGYGESGGRDVEYSGHCNDKHYPPVYAAGADQTVAVLRAAANLPFVDMSRGIVVGQSFGGTTALTLSTMNVPGLLGAVNFAGGGGGNPATHSANPCSEPRLRALFQHYGTSAKIPSLWLYSENDKY